MGEAVGGQSLRTDRVDLFQQHLGRGADLRLLVQQFREKKKNPFTGLLRLFAVIRQQLPDMILTVELQRQLPVGDVPPGAVERGCVFSALALAEDEVAVGGTAESGGAGDHVHGIIVIHLPQVMHQQNGNAVFIRQRFQNADVPVVAGIRIRVIARGADALERVDDDEFGLRMLFQELLDLFQQPVVELLGHDGEVQRGRCVLCEIEEAALDTLEAVLQTEVQHLAWPCGERPERLALCGAETKPQC